MSWYYILFLTSSVLALEPRVFSGDDLRIDVHTYLVKLRTLYSARENGICSGSIIDKHWIITAAHCFRKIKPVKVYHEVIHLSMPIAEVDPRYIFLHPKFNKSINTQQNRVFDIAIIKTTKPIQFNEWVQPVKLTNQYPTIRQNAIISGYGDVESGKMRPREGAVTIIPCEINIPGVFCSNSLVRAGSGDSGGPLVSDDQLIGVTAASCRNVYAEKECVTVYVSVMFHRRWLMSVMDDN